MQITLCVEVSFEVCAETLAEHIGLDGVDGDNVYKRCSEDVIEKHVREILMNDVIGDLEGEMPASISTEALSRRGILRYILGFRGTINEAQEVLRT